jgi:hypothetical protein
VSGRASRRRLVSVVAFVALASACSAVPVASPTTSTTTRAAASSTTTSTALATTSTTLPVTTTTIDPGLLPQTGVEPPLGVSLQTTLEPLFRAIESGSAAEAMPVFFPETAYVKMKNGLLPDPAGDYIDRLIGFYRLDLAAYHGALGASASSTKLLSVNALAADAAWIPPGDCENLIGYWHLPGVRMVYELDGVVNSFAVASLISWRGVWYVVHLGPNPRPVDVGTVDQPALGAGTPGPAGGC